MRQGSLRPKWGGNAGESITAFGTRYRIDIDGRQHLTADKAPGWDNSVALENGVLKCGPFSDVGSFGQGSWSRYELASCGGGQNREDAGYQGSLWTATKKTWPGGGPDHIHAKWPET